MSYKLFEQVYKKIINEANNLSDNDTLDNNSSTGNEEQLYNTVFNQQDLSTFHNTFWQIFDSDRNNYFESLIEFVSKYVDINKFICASYVPIYYEDDINEFEIDKIFKDLEALQNYNAKFTTATMVTAPRFGGVKIIIKIIDILKNPYLLGGDTYGSYDAALEILRAIQTNAIYNSIEEAKIDDRDVIGTFDNKPARKISVNEFKNSLLLWFKTIYDNAEINLGNFEQWLNVDYLQLKLKQN